MFNINLIQTVQALQHVQSTRTVVMLCLVDGGFAAVNIQYTFAKHR